MGIRVFLIDEQAIFRHGLANLLAQESDIILIGESSGDDEVLSTLARLCPDVVILDIGMETGRGLQIARVLGEQHPHVRVIFLSNYKDGQHLLQALETGAHSYLLKNTSHHMLAKAIRATHRGERLLAPEMLPYLVDGYRHLVQARKQPEARLSVQEIDILRMLSDGATSQDIAKHMFWSEVTVKRRVRDIEDKLQANNRIHAVATALRLGLI